MFHFTGRGAEVLRIWAGVDKLPSVQKAFYYGLYSGGRAAAGRRHMPAPEIRVPIQAIRREAELARDASSLRAVAREVGITPMGLRYFLLNQGNQQARTVRKLTEWYVRRMAMRPPGGESEARAALVILAGFYPESERARVLAGLLDALERDFRTAGMDVPPWVDALRRELLPGEG
jgi:hypothetical protein